MKKLVGIVLCCVLVCSMLFMYGCTKKAASGSGEAGTTAVAEGDVQQPSTGYASDELQQIYLSCNDELYVYADKFGVATSVDELEKAYEGYEYAGDITSISNKAMPSEQLQASHVAVGDKVYTKGKDVIIYEVNDNRVLEMKTAEKQ